MSKRSVAEQGPGRRCARRRRTALLGLVLAGSSLGGGCTFLENEFMTLDRRAPAASVEATTPPASVAARP